MAVYAISSEYSPERGFGLITEQTRKNGVLPPGEELNAGFEPQPWYRSGAAFRAGQTSGFIPSCLRIDVPAHGNYRVALTIAQDGPDTRYGDVSDAGLDDRDVLVFAGDRQLVFKGRMPENGRPLEVRATVNVSDFVPRGFEDRGPQPVTFVTLAVVGAHARPTQVSVEPAQVPTVWLAGDSTVTDEGAQYPYAPSDPYCGWGAALGAWLNDGVAVSNHARSGLTSLTFRSQRHYDPVRTDWKPGDVLLIQFGHNDQKLPELDARGGYRRELDRYITEARAAGVRPILVTSLARNTWNPDGSYHDLLHDWAEAVIELGRDRHVPVLDLHALSMKLVRKLGDEGARPMYHAGDRTHLHDVGAYRMAGLVAGEMRRVLSGWLPAAEPEGGNGDNGGNGDAGVRAREVDSYRALAACVTDGFGDWPLPPRAYDVDRPQLVVDQYLNPLYLKYTAEPYITGDISPFRKAMLLLPVEEPEEDAAAARDAARSAALRRSAIRRPLDVLLYVGPAIDPEPVVAAHSELAAALAAGHAVALVAYRTEKIEQNPASPVIPPDAVSYLRANADRYGISPEPVSVALGGELG